MPTSTETEVTELTSLDASKVSGVGTPANGTPWLLLKATEMEGSEPAQDEPKSDDSDDDGATKETPDADGGSTEADEIEDLVTKCGEAGCSVCATALTKKKLKAADRKKLDDEDYAYIDKKGGRHLPINDKAHVRNALARFNQTHFDSAEAKSKAHAKIVARAKSMGIEVSKEIEDLMKSPGVPDVSTSTPKATGHDSSTAAWGLAGGATAGLATPPSDPSYFPGGKSTYNIPAEDRANVVRNAPAPAPEPHAEVNKGTEVWIEVSDAQKGNWMAVPNPNAAQSTDPGDSAWEGYDAATLDSVARGLAAAVAAVTSIRQREATEAVSGNPSDWFDAWDLSCAADDINQALSLVARLAYHEAAAGGQGAEKGLSALSPLAQRAMRSTRDHLTYVLGDGATGNHAGSTGTEEENIMSTLTKEEFGPLVVASLTEAMAEVEKARKAARKEAKKARRDKYLTKAADALASNDIESAVKALSKVSSKKAEKSTAPVPNNGGAVTAADEEAGVTGRADADDVNAVPDGGNVEGRYVNKSSKGNKRVEALAKELSAQRELLEKALARPRTGGPVLDGIPHGASSASEGRTEDVTKGASDPDDAEIEHLTKQFESTNEPLAKEAAGRALFLAQRRRAIRSEA